MIIYDVASHIRVVFKNVFYQDFKVHATGSVYNKSMFLLATMMTCIVYYSIRYAILLSASF